MRAHDPPDRDVPTHSARTTRTTRPGTGSEPLTGSVTAILALQRRAGNAAVARAIQRLRSRPELEQRHQSHEHEGDQRPGPDPVQRSTVHDVLRSAGRPLNEPIRTEMEARLGADFSDVRLHTGPLAQRSAAEVGARAYTSGRHVVIGQGGADRHTLAHELTHVIQQRSGPVAGTDNDHGLRISDPGDAYERAAEANATRALAAPRPEIRTEAVGGDGNPVQRAPEAEGAAPCGVEASVPVQRWVWVDNDRIQPEDDRLTTDEMKELASDDQVHDYEDIFEFRDHAAGHGDFMSTPRDYIGNLPPGSKSHGTWVRFAKEGTNVLGENHEYVTLNHVLKAVGSSSFKYEAFAFDDMESTPKLRKAYDSATQDIFDQFEVGSESDNRKFGAESLFPKLAVMMYDLQTYVSTPERGFDNLKSPRYDGKPAQRCLKMAWAYGKDISNEKSKLSNRVKQLGSQIGKRPTEAEENIRTKRERLANEVKNNEKTLGPFIEKLDHTGYLGDSIDDLDGPYRDAVISALEKFCEAFVDEIIGQRNTAKGLDPLEQGRLGDMSEFAPKKITERWRNMHMGHAIKDAVDKGIRYVGIGQDHLEDLADTLPAGSHPYYMKGRDIETFKRDTEKRRNEATGG